MSWWSWRSSLMNSLKRDRGGDFTICDLLLYYNPNNRLQWASDLHVLILWYSWLDEINQKQSDLGAARINIEKLRQREHFMVAEIELLKVQKITFRLQKEDHVYFPFLMIYLAIIVGWYMYRLRIQTTKPLFSILKMKWRSLPDNRIFSFESIIMSKQRYWLLLVLALLWILVFPSWSSLLWTLVFPSVIILCILQPLNRKRISCWKGRMKS